MPRLTKREKRKQVWTTVDPDVHLKLEILEARTGFPMFWHIRKAIEEYVSDVTAVPPTDRLGNPVNFKIEHNKLQSPRANPQ